MSTAILNKIYIYPEKDAPCQELEACEALAESGLAGDRRRSRQRSVTLLSSEVWADTIAGLGIDLPPVTRRANLLVSGVDLQAAVGRRLQIGEVVLKVWGETEPCQKMDDKFQGLQQALAPEMRGGVCAEVEQEGRLRVGDEILLVGPTS
jgi:MOSC domain-containing protein YiiM